MKDDEKETQTGQNQPISDQTKTNLLILKLDQTHDQIKTKQNHIVLDQIIVIWTWHL